MPMNVLITAASRRVPLVQAFQSAIDTLGLPGRVIATDVNAYSPAVHMADRAYGVPLATDPGYIEALLDICKAERVSLVVPTIDDELGVFGEARERFRQVGAFAACSSAATAEACNDKYETCARLNALGVPAARTYRPHEIAASIEFPLFIKPRVGRGAVDAHIRARRPRPRLLPGLHRRSDRPGVPVGPRVHHRRAVRPARAPDFDRPARAGRDPLRRHRPRPHGEVAPADGAGRAVCEAFVFTGALNIQCRMRGSEAAVFEINPRFSGGIDLTIAAGADFPGLLVQMALGRRLMPRLGEFRDDLWICKYETAIFVQGSAHELPTLAETRARRSEVA
jgi:carbamoyl-phosphate synthase large subunit